MRIFWLRAATLMVALLAVGAAAEPASAGSSDGSSAAFSAGSSHSLIQGSGSSWSANAINQWIADVQSNGLQVVYTPSGSAQGRKDFAYKTTDFAVTEIGYQGTDPVTGAQDTSLGRAYAYLPVVAGGTSFPYQIREHGQLVRNLRLSGETLSKIFTNQITNWDDPEITSDNNGKALDPLPIIPVVHSEGSGTSAEFSKYMDTLYPSIWRAYQGQPGMTEYYPRKGSMIAQSGSDGVMNFITSKAANGAIGFDEYSYALAKNYPVVKLENAAGYFTLPTQYNVAVALTKAQINMSHNDPTCPTGPANCYLLQNLDKVYTFSDPRTYPMSSYSYMVIPTASDDPKMTTAKRQTLADFLYYSVCDGQKEMGPIGYSPLPINLVEASFSQIGQLKTADPGVDLTSRSVSTCHNPTFVAGQPTRNYLAEIAPKPPACDKSGAGPCTGNGDTGTVNPSSSTSGSKKTGSAASSTKGATTTAGATAASSGKVDPVTGQVEAGSGATNLGAAVPVSQQLPLSSGDTSARELAPFAVILLLLAIALPPILARRFGKPGRDAS